MISGRRTHRSADPQTDRRTRAATAAEIWAGPVSLWLWAESAVLHGHGPARGDFTG